MSSEHLPAPDLSQLRQRIDAVDEQLVQLLAARAALAGEVKLAKMATSLPVHDPGREQAILLSLTADRLGDFPVDTARIIFREIMSACRQLQQRPKVAYLGPEGTFTELAARQFGGACADYFAQAGFGDVFHAVARGEVTFGVVPVENSSAGTIREVLALLADTSVVVTGENHVVVHHCLLSQAAPADVTVVYSKDTALDQCRQWLSRNLPQAVLQPVASTTAGVKRAAAEPQAAAIAPERAAELYAVPLVARNIEDRHDNRTRFFSLGHITPRRSGRDKTSLLLSITHRPGSLVEALDVFRRHALNLTMIESHPSAARPFEYQFFIDLEGHIEDAEVNAAIEELRGHSHQVKVLGSYPVAS